MPSSPGTIIEVSRFFVEDIIIDEARRRLPRLRQSLPRLPETKKDDAPGRSDLNPLRTVLVFQGITLPMLHISELNTGTL
jgi:hypothetical protein